MSRIVRTIENIIVIPAGELPAVGGNPWYSGQGDPPNGGDRAGDGGGTNAATALGVNSDGFNADNYIPFLEIVKWGNVTAIEVLVEVSRDKTGQSGWGPLDREVIDADGAHVDVKPLKLLISKADYPSDGVIVQANIAAVASRIRFGVRAASGAVGGTEQVNMHLRAWKQDY